MAASPPATGVAVNNRSAQHSVDRSNVTQSGIALFNLPQPALFYFNGFD
jgi:hypothetical protein